MELKAFFPETLWTAKSPPLDVKLAYWNKKAACTSLETIRNWDFDRMILAHGHLIYSDAKQIFEQAYQFLLH